MRCLFYLILTFLIVVIIGGCSGGGGPATPDNGSLPAMDSGLSERTYLTTGTFTIDPENLTIENHENRQTDLVYNITGFLANKCPGGCFRFQIVNIVGTVLEIRLTVENPTEIQVYDLRLEYIDLFGKIVLNPDSYTDYLGAPITKIKPFTAFATDNPNRAFPLGPGGMDSQTLFLDFPPGSLAAVNYAVTVSFPGMTMEPYEINSMNQQGNLTPTGGSAIISCHVLDHQNNVSAVYLDARPFTGNPVMMIKNPSDPTLYEVTISNTEGAPIGTYNQLIMAMSSNPQNLSLYNYVKITVSDISSDPPVAVISSPCPDNFIWVGMSLYFDGRMSYDDNQIVGYAWDFDWDGNPLNFNVDSTLDHVNHQYMSVGVYKVGLRVEDNDGQFGYASVNVTVAIDTAPKWSMGALVSGMSGADQVERDYGASRQVVADCDGIVHMIIKNNGKLYYINYDGSTASTPELLASSLYIAQPTLELDDQGTLHLCYCIPGYIKYTRRESGTWSPAVTIASNGNFPGYNVEYPSMAINYRGEIMVVFAETTSGDTFYNGYTFNNGSGWSAPTNLTPFYVRIDPSQYTVPNNSLQAAPDGRFHLVYKSWPDPASIWVTYFWHVIWDSGSWGTISNFMSDSGYNIALSMSVAPDGDLFAVWQTNRFGTYNCMYQRWDGVSETWGSTIRVSKNAIGGSNSWVPDIAVDALGNVMYVWEYYFSEKRHVYYKQFNELDSASTILNATERELESSNGNMCNSNVFLGHDNKIHIIWEDDRSDPYNFYARDVYYSFWF